MIPNILLVCFLEDNQKQEISNIPSDVFGNGYVHYIYGNIAPNRVLPLKRRRKICKVLSKCCS